MGGSSPSLGKFLFVDELSLPRPPPQVFQVIPLAGSCCVELRHAAFAAEVLQVVARARHAIEEALGAGLHAGTSGQAQLDLDEAHGVVVSEVVGGQASVFVQRLVAQLEVILHGVGRGGIG